MLIDLPDACELQLAQFDRYSRTLFLNGVDALIELFDDVEVRGNQDCRSLVEAWQHDLEAARHCLARERL